MEFQIEIDDAGLNLLEDIKERTGVAEFKQIFNSGLSLLDWATREEAAGKAVATVDKKNQNYREVDMEMFDLARQRRKHRY